MVKTELAYNPYLLETSILFNGKRPRINSLVEKYKHSILQDWVKEIPGIFYDEMNGYNFKLEFSGTKNDFEDLKTTFRKAGITDDQVQFFCKNELTGREQKLEQIYALKDWLLEHPNKKFQCDSFQKENAILEDGIYTFILVHGRNIDTSAFKWKNISFEYIENIHEIDKTELTNTPILFYIDKSFLPEYQIYLKHIMQRRDVTSEQLFFMINPILPSNEIERVIRDLGIASPNIVTSLNDSSIKKFIAAYPVTNYIYQFINLLKKNIDTVKMELEKEKRQTEIANEEIYEQISALDNSILKLKEAHENFANRDNLLNPPEWTNAMDSIAPKIDHWKEKKTVIKNRAEAIGAAEELNEILQNSYQEFIKSIEQIRILEIKKISELYLGWYQSAELDTEYISKETEFNLLGTEKIPDIQKQLLELKEEEYVTPKDDLFELLFKSSEEERKEPVLEISYYYEKWREFAKNTILPIAKNIIEKNAVWLNDISDQLAADYQKHIDKLILKQTAKKEEIAVQLSDDEQKIQNDIDWIMEVCDQLKLIERG